MRLRGWWFLALLAGVVLFASARWVERVGRSLVGARGDSSTLRSLAYRIPGEGELVFDLPSHADLLRVFAHGELAEEMPLEDAEETRSYALRFVFEGWAGGTHERTYHFRSRVSARRGATGERLAQSSYLRAAAQPLDVRAVFLSLADLDFRTARVRVSAVDLEPELLGVAVRLYREEAVPESRRHARWPRLSVADRERRAIGNVYPQDLVSDFERRALVARSWLPLAPSGVEGIDYDRRVVLLNGGTEPEVLDVAPHGDALPANVIGVHRVEVAGPVEIQVALSGSAAELASTAPPRVEYLALDGSSSEVEPERLDDGRFVVSVAAEPGWLTFEAAVAMTLRRGGGAETDRVLATESITSYVCVDEGVSFRLVQLPGVATPLRIDLRTPGGVAARAELQFLGAGGERLAATEVEVGPDLSLYDWQEVGGPGERLSSVARYYVLAPAAAERLLVSGCRGVGPSESGATETLVSLYNQPPDLVRRVRVPASDGSGVERRWFTVLPTNAAALAAAGRTVRLQLQSRPRRAAPSTADDRVLKSYEPGAETTGRQLLIPVARPDGGGARGRYREVAAGRTIPLTFAGSRGDAIAPTLLFRRDADTPFRLGVELDGRSVLDEEWAGRQGEVRLPALAPGVHRVRLIGDDATSFLVDHIAGSAPLYVRRFIPSLPDRPFEVRVDKRGPTVLTGRLFYPPERRSGCSMRIDLPRLARPTGVAWTDWTYAVRQVDVEPVADGRMAALGGDQLWMERSHRFFVRLGADVPDGSVALRVAPKCGPPAYMTLSQLVHDAGVERRFSLERDAEAF